MMDLEQARRILELKPGATFRRVSEARDDLLDLWDPDRLSHHPRLRAKSSRKRREIHEAYEVVMESLGQGGALLDDQPPRTAAPSGATGTRGGESSPGRGSRASLYEEVFTRRKQKSSRQIPVWQIAGGVLVVLVALILFQWVRSDESPPAEVETITQGEDSGSAPLPPERPEPLEAATEKEQAVKPGEAKGSVPRAAAPTPVNPQPCAAAKPPPDQPSPPPPTTAPPPRPRIQERRPAEQRPALRRDGTPSAKSVPAEPDSEEEEKRQAEEYEKVFRDLLANAPAARKLVDEEYTDLRFSRWNIVEETGSEIWIELVALKPEGTSVHFTWAINPADGTTRALSAAARSLERTGQPD